MQQKKLFDALEKRTSMRVVRRVLVQNGFPRGQGWDSIKSKMKDKKVEANADFHGLEKGLGELLIAGDKGVRVFEVDNKNISAIRKLALGLKIDQTNVFAVNFPYLVSDKVLATLPPQPMTPVAKFQGPQGLGVLFSSINVIEVREKLNAAQIGATAANYDEVFGIRRVKSQTFNALIVSKTKDYAYILTDAHHDTTQGTRQGLHSEVRKTVNTLAGAKILNKPLNLLPLIERIYNSPEGLVKRLHYTTTTETGNQQWRRGSGNCLRDELAHKAAMTALAGGYKGYAIEVEYPLSEVNGYTPRPHIEIIGLYRMTYELDPCVEDATISGCATVEELEKTLAELMVHVTGIKSI